MKIDGACHCGQITYRAEADPGRVQICHCTDCQILSGSAFRTVVRVRGEDFELLSGRPNIYEKTAESGRKRIQSFCPNCGSPIYATSPGEGPKTIGIRLGTVRQRDRLVPKKQYWVRSARSWLCELAGLESIERQ